LEVGVPLLRLELDTLARGDGLMLLVLERELLNPVEFEGIDPVPV